VWTVALEYLDRPSPRRAVLAGVLLGGIVVVHGTELYTLLLILLVLAVGRWRQIPWWSATRDIAVAGLVGIVCALVYLPSLFHWAGGGGAYAVGLEDAQVPQLAGSVSSTLSAGPDPYVIFALGALGIDAPLRVVLIAAGVVWAFRARVGRAVLAIGLLFTLLATAFTYLSGRVEAIHQVYAALFPWGMHYRLFMIVGFCQALLAGAGAVWLLGALGRLFGRPGFWGPRVARLSRLLAVTWVLVMLFATTVFMQYPTGLVLGYGPDDAAAMAWLKANVPPGQAVVNDGYADGGIWAPFKAGVSILLPRWGLSAEEVAARFLIVDTIARLDQEPAAMAAACERDARYVYRGSRASEWDARRFPSLAELRASPSLEEVYSSGEAVVFRTRLRC
jgi:hypothetical protein